MKFLPSVTQRNGGIIADWLIIVCSIIAGLIAGIPINWSGEIISLDDVGDGVVLTPTEIYVHNGLIALFSGVLGRIVIIGIVSLSGVSFGFSLSASLAMRGFWASVHIVWLYAPLEFIAWFFVLRASFSVSQFYRQRKSEGIRWLQRFVVWECVAQSVLTIAAVVESRCM